MTKFILAASTALLLATPALAQTETPAAPVATTAAAPTAQAGGSEAGGMTMGSTSTVALKFVTVSDADLMASKLEDLNVYNNQNEEIGEIQDLVIKDGKTISGVVVSVGGFLGLGDRYVLLDPSSIVLNQKDNELKAFVNTSKEELTAAPEFKYEND